MNKYAIRIFGLFALIAGGSAVWFVFGSDVSPERITQFVDSLGIWGPLGLIFYFIVGHVVAPILGTPGFLAGLSLYGPKVFLYLYIAGLISSTINFYLSRTYGRAIIKKLGGEKTLTSVDLVTSKFGMVFLVVARLIGSAFFDVISYAAGLTNIPFKHYFAITALVGAVPILVFTSLLSKYELSLVSMGIFFGVVATLGTLFLIFVRMSITAPGKSKKRR